MGANPSLFNTCNPPAGKSKAFCGEGKKTLTKPAIGKIGICWKSIMRDNNFISHWSSNTPECLKGVEDKIENNKEFQQNPENKMLYYCIVEALDKSKNSATQGKMEEQFNSYYKTLESGEPINLSKHLPIARANAYYKWIKNSSALVTAAQVKAQLGIL